MRELLTRNVPMGATASAAGFFAAAMLKVRNPFAGSTLFSQLLTRAWDFFVSGNDIAILLNPNRTIGYVGGNIAVKLIATLISGTKPNVESVMNAAGIVASLSVLVGHLLIQNGYIQEEQNAPIPRLG